MPLNRGSFNINSKGASLFAQQKIFGFVTRSMPCYVYICEAKTGIGVQFCWQQIYILYTMGKIIYCLLFGIILVNACNRAPSSGTQRHENDVLKAAISDQEVGFLNNLSVLCGKSFRGEQSFMAADRESWADKDFVMHVELCDEERIHIPFHLDDDQSRTWMFLVEDGRLRFRHDHRHADGSPEDLTLYGGYSDGEGTAFRQHFPADQYTIDLLADTLGRQWNIIMDEALTKLSYQLQYKGEIVFQADFDLSNPL